MPPWDSQLSIPGAAWAALCHVLQQLSFFKSLCGDTQLKSTWGSTLAVRSVVLSHVASFNQGDVSVKQRCLVFSSGQSHSSVCVVTLFFMLLGKEFGCKIARVASGASLRKDATFAGFCCLVARQVLKSMILSNLVFGLFRPPGEVPVGASSSDFILTISSPVLTES